MSVTETDFVVVEDVTSLDSSAVVLKGTVVLKFAYVPNREMIVKCSMEGLELFSCNLSNEDESALSILDPVSVSLELKPSERRLQHSNKAVLPETVISQVFEVREGGDRWVTTPYRLCALRLVKGRRRCKSRLYNCLQVEIEQLSFRLSYNDIKLFLAIAQSLPNLESKEPRPDSLKKYEKEIKGTSRIEGFCCIRIWYLHDILHFFFFLLFQRFSHQKVAPTWFHKEGYPQRAVSKQR